MDRRTFLMQLALGSGASTLYGFFLNNSSVIAQEKSIHKKVLISQTTINNFVNVYQFGRLVSGKTNRDSVRISNARIIQKAIDTVGQQGGGTIYIPTGYYQVSPQILIGDSPSSIVINHDNITLIGDGIGKTIIESRGAWSLINNQVVRGHGIMIRGTNNSFQPRKNITIKNLELSGGTTGFTGNRGWPANPTNGDGWDITHKGIVLDFDKYLDNITIDSVYVHDFRGEVIYAGGIGVEKVTILNTKLHASNASMLSLDANLSVTKCQFSQTANAWVENAPVSPNKSYYFDECIFKDSTAHGLVVAQGNFSENRKVIVTNCSFYNSHGGICPFGGASNFVVTKNKFYDINNALFTSGINKNIEFYENQIYGQTQPVTTAYLFGQVSNVLIKNNSHQAATNTNVSKASCIFYYGDLKNIIIDNNIFENCRTPEQLAELTNERPLFKNNQYINVERRDLQGSANFWQVSLPYVIEPKCEEVVVSNITNNSVITIEMNISRYVDGQEVLITSASASDKTVLIASNCQTIKSGTDIALTGQGQQVRLKFDKSISKWSRV